MTYALFVVYDVPPEVSTFPGWIHFHADCLKGGVKGAQREPQRWRKRYIPSRRSQYRSLGRNQHGHGGHGDTVPLLGRENLPIGREEARRRSKLYRTKNLYRDIRRSLVRGHLISTPE